MTIKVGQIYKVPYLGGKVAISWIRADKTEFHMVRDDGFFLFSKDDEMGKDSVLLAEYPTWQEAVNSKEFNDIYKTTREIELEKKLEIAISALGKLQRRNCIDCKCGENCSLREYSKKGKGCSTCVAGLAQEALAKIKEIKE